MTSVGSSQLISGSVSGSEKQISGMASTSRKIEGQIRPGEAKKLIRNFEKASQQAVKKRYNVLIVYAHPEPKSFNSALLKTAVKSLREYGHNVTVSDLYKMNFNPLTTRQDVVDYEDNGELFQYSQATGKAWAEGRLSEDIVTEQSKLDSADLVILQFPVQWYGFPAILKGWIDRVLTYGFAFEQDKMFEYARFKEKKLLLSFTTGAPDVMYTDRGLNGDLNVFLWPLQLTFRLVGFNILAPQVSFSPGMKTPEDRTAMLNNWSQRLEGVFKESVIYFLPLTKYNGVTLKDEEVEELEKNKYAPTPGQHLGIPHHPTSMRKPTLRKL